MTLPAHKRRPVPLVATAIILAAAAGSPSASAEQPFRYDADTVDIAAHWAARATLANAVMFSGLGEPLSMSMTTRDAILRHAGYVTRPAMPDMAMVGAVYADGDPAFEHAPDFSRPRTLRWDPSTFDRTLAPAAQAWALVKITSPAFHLNFHERKADRRIALVMLPQARAQAEALEKRLLDDRGLFASRRPDGTFREPAARDQAAVLWGVSNLILAATSRRDDYWHAAWRDLIDADDYRELAHRARTALETLPPETPGDRALSVEALGRYALATTDAEHRREALTLARRHAERLRRVEEASLDDAALAVYGLVEAGRLLADERYATAAARLFRTALLPKWNAGLGAFAAGDRAAYTPATVAAVAAALNAMRWHGPADLAGKAARLYPRFLETVLVRAGMLLSSPLPLVPAEYREGRPDDAFAHPALPAPAAARLAPVFAGEVRHEGDGWSVTERRFRTDEALFLANTLVMPRDGQSDLFLPADRLKTLER